MEPLSPPQSPLRYRPDIDGLRALAVLLVVFSHLDIEGFKGGYVGVDVFFVISGYLISGILLRELAVGTFSFATFYERRVRRIAPALLAMLAVTLYLAHRYYFPPAMYDYARTMIAALLSSSNFLFMQFWRYFDPENQTRPLLHTWSLAVEEQYYLVFPVLLVAIHRWWQRARKPIIWALTLLSFAAVCLQMYYSYGRYSVAFFFSPLRFWELLIGTILYDIPKARTAWQRNLMSTAGLLAILLPAHLYGPLTPFPGPAALPPCLGAALLIAAGETGPSLLSNVLSWRPIRFIGLISYSLYLVHWPILLFQKDAEILINAERYPHFVKPVVLAVSLLVATLSWRFIEMPFRQSRLRSSRRQLYTLTGSVFAILLLAGILLVQNGGWGIPHVPYTFSEPSRRYIDFGLRAGDPHPGKCFVLINSFSDFTPSTCLTEDPHRPNWLLFGDSHSHVLYEGLHKAFPTVNISQASMAGCRPMVTPTHYVSDSCNQLTALVFKDYLLHHPVDAVLLDCRWGFWMVSDLEETLTFLKSHGIKVFLLGSSIEYDAPLPSLIAIAEHHHDPTVYTAHRLISAQETDEFYARIARDKWKVPYISMYADLCHPHPGTADPPWQVRRKDGCPVFATSHVPLLSDDNHLTPEGSFLFAAAIKANHELP
jgi:peptidoglycan/LPS O-acetylase OafA/YrhL